MKKLVKYVDSYIFFIAQINMMFFSSVLLPQGLEKVAKAIWYHQKDMQTRYTVDPIEPNDMEPQLWKASLLTETLEILAKNVSTE